MNPERWQQVEQLCQAALDCTESQRAAFLDRACAGDDALRQEVDSLLKHQAIAKKFIEVPALEVAAKVAAVEQVRSLVGQQISHYQIVSLLGAGGMGEVYLAKDSSLGRQVALKLLPAQFTQDASRLLRFKQEARATSALNHPNIITIHEIGEVDGTHYIATEFINGQTLRQLIARERVRLGDAVEVTMQVASALAAAHTAGVVHRDIKPENIMVRPDGYVKVLDFGLAKLTELQAANSDREATTAYEISTGAGVVMGTFRYMSPEQARGQKVDARSDLFSLGVVLYELVAGRSPFEGATMSEVIAAILEREPPPLARYSPEVPAGLERIIAKALCKDREERYQTARDLQLDLKSLGKEVEIAARVKGHDPAEAVSGALRTETLAQEIAASTAEREAPHTTSSAEYIVTRLKSHWRGALITLVVLVITVIAALFYSSRVPALTEKDTILLADFVNTTGEAVFDGTLKQALAVQLQQTPFLNLYPEEGVRETLRYMGRPAEDRVTRDVGREICQRQGLKALLLGTIASLGHNYVITLEAINGRTGGAIASQQIEAEGKEKVLQALGQAANGLRRKLGESLSTLQKYNAPIEQATTSSLEALKAYSKGLEQIYSGNPREARRWFDRAIELDHDFAAAYNWLSWTQMNPGGEGPKRAAEFAEKAYALRERVTEIERLHITDIYHLWATGEWDKQREVDELIKQVYPNDWTPYNSLTITYLGTGQPEKAAAEAPEGIRRNPNEIHLYWHLSTALMRLNRFDEAKEVIRQAQARNLDAEFLRRNLYQIAFARRDGAAMQQQLNLMAEKDGERVALTSQAAAAAFAGQWRDAQAFYHRLAELGQRGTKGRAAPLPIGATIQGALFGFCEPGGEGTTLALAVSRITAPISITVPILPDGSLCGEVSEAERLADEFEKRYPKATRVKGFSLPIIRAASSLRRNKPDRAIELLQAAFPTSDFSSNGSGFWLSYLRGQAYLRLGRSAEAATEFRKILDHRGWDPLSVFYPLAHLALARASALAGDVAGSRKAYQDFLSVWKDADPDLPILVEAKKEYERLK